MPTSDSPSPRTYVAESQGYRFRMGSEDVRVLRTIPEFESREEPAIGDEFLRERAEVWADALASAGAAPGEYSVRVDAHQRRARLSRGDTVVFTAEI